MIRTWFPFLAIFHFDSATQAASQTQQASQAAVTNALNILAKQKQQAITQLGSYLQQNPMPFSGASIKMPNYATTTSPTTIGGGTAGGSGGISGGTYGGKS